MYRLRERSNTACTHSHCLLQGRRWKPISIALAANAWPEKHRVHKLKQIPREETSCNRHATTSRPVISQIPLLSFAMIWMSAHYHPSSGPSRKDWFQFGPQNGCKLWTSLIPDKGSCSKTGKSSCFCGGSSSSSSSSFYVAFPNRKQKKKINRKRGKMQTIKLFVKTRQKLWIALIPDRNMIYIKNIFHQTVL